MITSPLFLEIANSSQPAFIALLLESLSFQSVINKCVFSDPNYGGCWFAAKTYPLGSAEEVLLSSIQMNAISIACNSDLYYQALFKSALKNSYDLPFGSMKFNPQKETSLVPFSKFAFAFLPLYVTKTGVLPSYSKQLKYLFGTSQIEG